MHRIKFLVRIHTKFAKFLRADGSSLRLRVRYYRNLERSRTRSGDVDVTRGVRLDRNDLLKSFFRRASLASIPVVVELHLYFRSIPSYPLARFKTAGCYTYRPRQHGYAERPTWSIYQRQFRAATGNTVIRARGGGEGEEGGGEDGTPFSGEFLGW